MKNIAIIPARSGSKGLKDKNIMSLCGKPLMQYTIEAAQKSNCFETIHVSTDLELYASIARESGAHVPYLRPEKLSSDHAGTWDVVKYVLDQYRNEGTLYDTVCVLQPTSPLRTSMDIKNSYQLFYEKNAKSIVSVCETNHSPLWCNQLPENLSMENFISKEIEELPRQFLRQYYQINGAIYIITADHLNDVNFLYDKDSFAYIMASIHSVDIDKEEDFLFVETLIRNGKAEDI